MQISWQIPKFTKPSLFSQLRMDGWINYAVLAPPVFQSESQESEPAPFQDKKAQFLAVLALAPKHWSQEIDGFTF